MRLIDADDCKYAIEKRIDKTKNEKLLDFMEGLLEAMVEIDLQPTIEAEPVIHGKWIAVTLGDMRCSCCGGIYGVCGGLMGDYNYCPNCGARMDLKK